MNKYLVKLAMFEKLALRRVIKELSSGKLKVPVEELLKLKAIKSPNVYTTGLRRGNQALAEKENAAIKRVRSGVDKFLVGKYGYATANVPERGGVVLFDPSKSPTKVLNEASIRHEIYEVAERNLKVGKQSPMNKLEPELMVSELSKTLPKKTAIKVTKTYQHGDKYNPYGYTHHGNNFYGHQSPAVLVRESEMVRKNPYLSQLKDIRLNNGEASFIERLTGKKYGVDKMTGKEMKLAREAKPKYPAQPNGMPPVDVFELT